MFGRLSNYVGSACTRVKQAFEASCTFVADHGGKVLAWTIATGTAIYEGIFGHVAQAQVTLPATGIDAGDYSDAGISVMSEWLSEGMGWYIALFVLLTGVALWAKLSKKGKAQGG